eukprot:CAMPEP_0201141166 /NCGR_PEP_ID=MMETSP0851-20130426/2779_1 /ASSEMBLY_ACC=CAM_ASM_000631 /TAXON_ID=183588 /ORGANISM="Pseudo-nitzschia fraudulenta, Strain WWA7" /LENGTH=40 /DNA_ID= /DNA_START= /DNA_END= /DNA_ORIENTATION=
MKVQHKNIMPRLQTKSYTSDADADNDNDNDNDNDDSGVCV